MMSSTIVKKNKTYKINSNHYGIAIIEDIEPGKNGFLDVTTNEIIGKINSNNFKVIGRLCKSTDDRNIMKEKMDVYDLKEKKLLAQNWPVIDDFYNESGKCKYVILLNPEDGKKHFLHFDKYGTSDDIWPISLDDYQRIFIPGRSNNVDRYFIITHNNKKGIYSYKLGMVVAPEYDDIKITGYDNSVIIFTKDGKQRFTFLQDENPFTKKTFSFDKVVAEDNSSIIYCELDGVTYVYDSKCKKLIFSSNLKNVVLKKMSSEKYTSLVLYDFLVEDNSGKVGLVRVSRDDDSNRLQEEVLLRPIYDEIKLDRGTYIISKNGKKGLLNHEDFFNHRNETIFVKPMFDDFTILQKYGGEVLLQVPSNGLFDLISIKQKSNRTLTINTILQGCSSIEKLDDYECRYRYEKDNHFGLFNVNFICTDHYRMTDNDYSTLEEWCVKNHFEVSQDNKKGIIHFNGELEEIVPIEYTDIDFQIVDRWENMLVKNFSRPYDQEKLSRVYLALKKSNGKYDLAKLVFDSKEEKLKMIEDHDFDDVKLFPNLMILKKENNCYVYNYNEKLLATLPSYDMLSRNDNIYNFDDNCYIHKDGTFYPVESRPVTYYTSTYEDDSQIFEVASTSPKEYASFCDQIDSLNEQDVIKKLEETIENMDKTKQTHIPSYQHTTLKRLVKTKN